MSRALLLTGGLGHPAEASDASLRAVCGSVGLTVDAHTDLEQGLAALGDDHDLLVVNALAFSMPHERYDDVRDEHAFALSTPGGAAIEAWHGAGKPVLALHTAIISFDTWPGWADIVGGRWDWTRSHHPPLGPATIRVAGGDVTIEDETYRDLALADDLDVVASAVVDGDAQPVAWTRAPAGKGRVAVDLLGHDRRSLDHPAHVALLRGLLRWLLGDDDTCRADPTQDDHR